MRFAVLGSPIDHSLSPVIHHAFAKGCEITLSYERKETKLSHLKEVLNQFKKDGGAGGNVTLPLKMEAFALCDQLSSRAQEAGAINTFWWEGEKLCGDNTDGEGLVRDLTLNCGLALKDKRILILGAGGAVRGILSPLLALSPAGIVIVNRTLEKAKALIEKDPNMITAFSSEEALQKSFEAFDIVINATSASLQNTLPLLSPDWLRGSVAIDLAYRLGQKTIFMREAKAQGAKEVHDGVGMLVEQAALGFYQWHQVRPNTKEVIAQLREEKKEKIKSKGPT